MPTRYRASKMQTTGGHNIKIQGRLINIHLARMVYRCGVCFGELELHGSGLRCKADHNHRFFAHQSEVKAVEVKREENIKKLQGIYQIIDGKVTLCQS